MLAGYLWNVIQYLSDEWLAAANEAVSASNELRKASEGQDVAIAYEVTGAPSGKVTYGLVFRDGASSVEPGPHRDAPTSFSLDYDTASQIAQGELSAQAAFMQGRLKVGGDVTVLVNQYRLIDGLDDALGKLREQTEY